MLKRKEIDSQNEDYETLENAFIRFIKKLFSMFTISYRFDEFLKKTGEYFDERIALEEKQNNLKYVGGRINFTLSGNQVDMQAKLYFMNEAEKWIAQETSNSVDKSRFNDWDTDEDLKKLARGGVVELDITPPE